ncbi:MAG: hypothetical protein P4L61_03910 [Candidatus Pacebacteria bacterium]|nr:hypothetical protein [Candidatus Paceibacterota bacterium]
MKTPKNEEDIYPYTDKQASIQISSNGHGSCIGIGKIFLDSEEPDVLCVSFDSKVDIQTCSKKDAQTNQERLEPVPIIETYKKDKTEERFTPVVVVKATNNELQLRSNKSKIRVYLYPSLTGRFIESILSHCQQLT